MVQITDQVSYGIWLDYMEERGYNRYDVQNECTDDGAGYILSEWGDGEESFGTGDGESDETIDRFNDYDGDEAGNGWGNGDTDVNGDGQCFN